LQGLTFPRTLKRCIKSMEKKNFREQHEIAATGSFLNNERLVDYMKMMTLEEAKEYTRQKLAPYYSNERIENVVKQYVSVIRPGVILVKNKNVGLMELYL